MKKVFIGLLDIASQISDWNRGFKELGYETFTAALYRMHIAQRMEVDVDISTMFKLSYRGIRPRKLQTYLQDRWNFSKNKVFNKALEECDIFIFIGSSFYNDYSDLKKIKDRGKKLVFIFTGEDCRWYFSMKQEFEMFGLEPIVYPPTHIFSAENLAKQISYLRNAEKYADVIMSLPNQAQLALRPYERFICALDLEKFSFSGEQRVVPRIVHAPTGHHFKGTKHFLNAIERLRQDGVKFEFELIEDVSNQIALEKYTNADIILGQVYCPCGGKLAHEGMALGKVVLTRMGFDKGYDEKTPEGCSLVDIGPDNIYEKLKELISNASKRRELSVRGRAYVEKNNDCTLAAKRIIELLSTKEDIEPEFIPNFFRNHFVPESNEAAIVYNKWNAYLSDCHWYSKYVGTFDRNGLKF